MMKTKALGGVEIKELGDDYHVEAVFATLNVKDKDGDVTTKGAFKNGSPVRISAYNHGSWQGALPIGKGTIHEEGDSVVFRGQFFKTQAAQDTRETLKGLGELAEWSYGFDVTDADHGDFKGEDVRFLKGMTVHEVSPVLIGAGVNTRTLSVKAKHMAEHAEDDCPDPDDCPEHGDEEMDDEERRRRRRRRQREHAERDEKRSFTAEQRRALADSGKAMPDGSFPIANEEDLHNAIRLAGNASNPAAARRHIMRRARAMGSSDLIPEGWSGGKGDKDKGKSRLADDLKAVLADLEDVGARAVEVKAIRTEKGKGLGDESLALVTKIRARLEELDELLKESGPDNSDLENAYLRYLQMTSMEM
jgi:HK97 family phage prohead protease